MNDDYGDSNRLKALVSAYAFRSVFSCVDHRCQPEEGLTPIRIKSHTKDALVSAYALFSSDFLNVRC